MASCYIDHVVYCVAVDNVISHVGLYTHSGKSCFLVQSRYHVMLYNVANLVFLFFHCNELCCLVLCGVCVDSV